jgi:uncharacterized protein YhfF
VHARDSRTRANHGASRMCLQPHEKLYWQRYIESLEPSDIPESPVVTAAQAGSPEETDNLLELYLSGAKTAGSSILEDFSAAGDPLPKVGNFWICLASDGRPRCILRTTRIETHNFRDVPETIAIAEGEGDLSIAHWKRVHTRSYAPHIGAWGLSEMAEATVITEFFQVVFRWPC